MQLPTVEAALYFLIQKGPGRTKIKLAEAIYGNDHYQQQVNQDCRLLANKGLVERRGDGGRGDPFTYWPVQP